MLKSDIGEKRQASVLVSVHPLQAALLEWAKRNPQGRVTIIFQDGVPIQLLAPTPDGLGQRSISMAEVARSMGLLK